MRAHEDDPAGLVSRPARLGATGTRSIVRNIMQNTRPGSIILEHDGGGNRSETVAALRIVIPALIHEGYHFVTP
jgi:peptidoglycan-N-acetylglucosamine deacetylase